MFLFKNFNSFPTIRSGSFVERDLPGNAPEKAVCAAATAADHVDCRRRDMIVVPLGEKSVLGKVTRWCRQREHTMAEYGLTVAS